MKAPWHACRPQPRPRCVRWAPNSPQKRGTASPQFLAHVHCGEMAGWIKMPLGVEVGFGPSDFVLDGDTAPPPQKKGTWPPIFGPCLLWPNGWMDQDATWCGGEPRPRRHCVRWGSASCPHKKGARPNNFWPMFIVAKWSPISTAAKLL